MHQKINKQLIYLHKFLQIHLNFYNNKKNINLTYVPPPSKSQTSSYFFWDEMKHRTIYTNPGFFLFALFNIILYTSENYVNEEKCQKSYTYRIVVIDNNSI